MTDDNLIQSYVSGIYYVERSARTRWELVREGRAQEYINGYKHFDGISKTLSDGTTITVRGDGFFDISCPTYGRYLMAAHSWLTPTFEDPLVVHDLTGYPYSVGDMVAVATVNNRSPQLTYGQVTKLSARTKDGKQIGRECPDVRFKDDVYMFDAPFNQLAGWHTQIQPLVDGRGFYRSEYGGKPKRQTYTFPGNIVATQNFKA